MKFIKTLTLIYLFDILVLFSMSLAQNWNEWLQIYGNQYKRTQQNCLLPIFNCRLTNKLRPKKRQTAKQSAQKPNPALSPEFGAYGQPSISYPSYSVPVYAGSSYVPHYSQLQGSGNEYPMASTVNSQYESHPAQTGYTAQNYGQSPNTIDVHQVLDQFIRSAGLSPQGDHESEAAHSSSFAKAGTKPVLVFKRLFSFPFYLSTDPNVVDIYGKGWK